MKVLIGTSEIAPYSKTGGLADMTAALGKYLGAAGVCVGVVTPLYSGILERDAAIYSTERLVKVQLGSGIEEGRIYECEASDNLTIYFVDHKHFYRRGGIYGEADMSYPDNAQRFLFLSKVILELSRQLPWRPDLVHLHDWQVAMFPVLLQNERQAGRYLSPPKTLLTIHNLAYQGIFSPDLLRWANLPWTYFHFQGLEYYGQLNFLKAGIVYADYLNTVSPSYADEILTRDHGCGLEGALNERSERLIGILNGVDYAEWKTTDNPYLEYSFSLGKLSGKAKEKQRLQRDLGLEVDPQIPLFGNISRLVEQKGIALMAEALRQGLLHFMQFVLLGSGEKDLEAVVVDLAESFPGRVHIRIGYDVAWSHRIEAACDFYLMPSLYEPCGLNQLYSMRYGTIPIVHAVGGLSDSVIDETQGADRATGIKFEEFTSAAVLEGIFRALELFGDADRLQAYRRRAMVVDYSWSAVAQSYLDYYRRILEAR